MGNMNEVPDPTKSPIGQSLRRREDRRFVTGDGQFTDDVTLPGQTYGVFLRSPLSGVAYGARIDFREEIDSTPQAAIEVSHWPSR